MSCSRSNRVAVHNTCSHDLSQIRIHLHFLYHLHLPQSQLKKPRSANMPRCWESDLDSEDAKHLRMQFGGVEDQMALAADMGFMPGEQYYASKALANDASNPWSSGPPSLMKFFLRLTLRLRWQRFRT